MFKYLYLNSFLDLKKTHVEHARGLAHAAGLTNATFELVSFDEMIADRSIGPPEADVMVAYEPVWAIGTGETATPADAAAAHATLRAGLVHALGEARGASVPILYGGSVKPGNAEELMSAANVDGVLVGGASLDPESFGQIAQAGAKTLG